MRDPFVDKALIEFLEDSVKPPKYDIFGNAEEYMRAWAKYEGKVEILTKLKNLEKKN